MSRSVANVSATLSSSALAMQFVKNRTVQQFVGLGSIAVLLNTPDVWVTNASSSPQVYDIFHGAPYYTTPGSGGVLNFAASRWLAGTSSNLCNCYDVAAAVWYYAKQAGAGASVRYAFMNPFGYLAKTQLKRRGTVNNPFYGMTGGPPVIAQTDSARTAFGNHAFMELTSNGTWYVLDACAGPHTGGDTVPAYIAQAVDPVHHVPGAQNGTINSITFPFSTLSVSVNISAPFLHEGVFLQHVTPFAQAVGTPVEVSRTMDILPAPWDALRDIPALGREWSLHYEEIIPGYPETVGYRQYVRGSESVIVQLFVASDDSDTAHRRFLERGSSHEAPGPIFERGPAQLGEHSARATSPGVVRHLWRDNNIVYDVTAPASVADAVVHSIAQTTDRPRTVARPPHAAAPTASHAEAAVGQTVTVGVDAPDEHVVEVAGAHDGLKLVGRARNQLVFHADKPADDHVVVVSVDRRTLLATASATRVVIR